MKYTPRVTHISRHRKDGGGWGGVGRIVSFNIYIEEDGGTMCVDGRGGSERRLALIWSFLVRKKGGEEDKGGF